MIEARKTDMIRPSRNIIHAAALLAALLLLLPCKASAYIDPGTGSYMLQLVLAALLGGLFAVKMFWRNIKSFFVNLLSGRQKQPKDDR